MQLVVENLIRGLVFVSFLWLAFDFLVNWGTIHLGARWVDIFHATSTKALIAAAGVTVGPGLVTGLIWGLGGRPSAGGFVLGILVGLIVGALVIRAVYDSTWPQAGAVTVMTLIGHALAVLVAFIAAALIVPLLV